MIEINQRGAVDWAVYADGEYKGTVSRIGLRQFEFVCTHSSKRYQTREDAISFLVERAIDHLSALELRLSHERDRLVNAKTEGERELRRVWIAQIEREIAAERKVSGEQPLIEPEMSDDELLAALNA